MARASRPKPGEWKYVVGEPPHQLTAHERADRGNRIYSRLWSGKGRYSDKRELCDSIRDEKGKIDPAKEIAAQQLAVKRQSTLASGLASDRIADGPPTLATGFQRVLHPTLGKWPQRTNERGKRKASEHASDVRRAAAIVVKELGGDVLFSAVKHGHYRKLWREMIHEHMRSGRTKYGPVWIQRVCEVMAATANWLQQEELLEPGEAEPARGWKAALRREWEEITGMAWPQPKKPRHQGDDPAKLFEHAPRGDPRLWLAMEIGAELRLGQVLRTRRSDIEASPDGTEPLWAVWVRGRGKKLGARVVLDARQREVLRYALTRGHLAELEAEHAAGRLDDYYLFPAGRLSTFEVDGEKVKRVVVGKGRSRGEQRRTAPGQAPLARTAMADHFAELEHLAGVKHQKGRGWYGLRRRGADDAAALEGVPDAVRNQMGGWSKTSTREGYLEGGRVENEIAASEVRTRIRGRTAPKGE